MGFSAAWSFTWSSVCASLAQSHYPVHDQYTHVVGKLCLRAGFQSPLSATSGATPCFSTITRFWRCSFLLSISLLHSSLFCFFVPLSEREYTPVHTHLGPRPLQACCHLSIGHLGRLHVAEAPAVLPLDLSWVCGYACVHARTHACDSA